MSGNEYSIIHLARSFFFKVVGRLANYKYFNMDQSILNALELFDADVEKMKTRHKAN